MIVVLVVLVLLLGALCVILISGNALGRRGPDSTIDRAEARRLANLEAERLLGERYREGELSLEEFERELAGLLERRDGLRQDDG